MRTAKRAALLLTATSLPAYASAKWLVFAPAASTNSTGTASALSGPSSCTSYHGTYDNVAVYGVEDDCNARPEDWLDAGSIVPGVDGGIVMHVQRAVLDEYRTPRDGWLNRTQDHIASTVDSIAANNPEFDAIFRTLNPKQQIPLAYGRVTPEQPQLLHIVSDTSFFYSIPRSILPMSEQIFGDEAVLVSIPSYALPLRSLADAPSWLGESLKKLSYSPLIDALSSDFDTDQIRQDVRYLTGEDKNAPWVTRHSFTKDARDAAQWIKGIVEKEGGANCHFHEHAEGFSPNVICDYKGEQNADELVILGAHYDSRGSFGSVRAPGGDDDGSGVSALLSIARSLKGYNIRLKRTVQLAFFSGEEQGLWGSRGYAKKLKDEGANVRFMLQADMLGYHLEGEPMQIAFPDKYDTIEARWLIGNMSQLYQPQLQVGTTPACCSDHQSFDQQGFVSTWVFERNGPIADPMYHNWEDYSDREGYDFEQIASIASVMYASVLEIAGFHL